MAKELDAGYGLPDLACKGFWATEAALSFAVLAHNLIVLFERRLGWLEAVTLGSLRYRLFVTAGIISRPQGRTTIKLAEPSQERDWWQSLGEKLRSPNPNCNAVETRPSSAVGSPLKKSAQNLIPTAWLRLSVCAIHGPTYLPASRLRNPPALHPERPIRPIRPSLSRLKPKTT